MTHSKKSLWVGNLDTTAFIFYQGRSQSQVQASRYIGNHRMGTSTGELVDSKYNRVLTIPRERLWVYPEIEEINRNEQYEPKRFLLLELS